MIDTDLAEELCALLARDDHVRERLAATGSLFRGYHPEMEAVHRENALRLHAIVQEHGWPERRLVGETAANAAWLVLQHAIGEPALVRAMFPLVAKAAESGEIAPAHLAMLEDRIRVLEGRPQRYGTQYDWHETDVVMVPMIGVEAPERVDELRASVGLPPMQWRRAPPLDEPHPLDPAARRAQTEAWARRRGWR